MSSVPMLENPYKSPEVVEFAAGAKPKARFSIDFKVAILVLAVSPAVAFFIGYVVPKVLWSSTSLP